MGNVRKLTCSYVSSRKFIQDVSDLKGAPSRLHNKQERIGDWGPEGISTLDALVSLKYNSKLYWYDISTSKWNSSYLKIS